MRSVNVTTAKAQLTALIREAEAGRTVVICRDGKPVAELHPPSEVQPINWEAGDRYMRERGIDWSGVVLPDDFNEARGIDGLE